MSEEFVTPKQVAERLHVKTSTIWEWTRRRQQNPIPHYPVSRKIVYFKWSEVERWVEEHRQ
jgi:excisionase family DNA binding protein